MTDLVAWFWANVWPNLVASGICTGIVWWRARVHIRLHREAHDRRHAEVLSILHRNHKETP